MTAISLTDGIVCGWPRCGIQIVSDEAGKTLFHWLQPDQRDRSCWPHNNSPVCAEAFNAKGVRHSAVLPSRGVGPG